jgi:hypothetical protein
MLKYPNKEEKLNIKVKKCKINLANNSFRSIKLTSNNDLKIIAKLIKILTEDENIKLIKWIFTADSMPDILWVNDLIPLIIDLLTWPVIHEMSIILADIYQKNNDNILLKANEKYNSILADCTKKKMRLDPYLFEPHRTIIEDGFDLNNNLKLWPIIQRAITENQLQILYIFELYMKHIYSIKENYLTDMQSAIENGEILIIEYLANFGVVAPQAFIEYAIKSNNIKVLEFIMDKYYNEHEYKRHINYYFAYKTNNAKIIDIIKNIGYKIEYAILFSFSLLNYDSEIQEKIFLDNKDTFDILEFIQMAGSNSVVKKIDIFINFLTGYYPANLFDMDIIYYKKWVNSYETLIKKVNHKVDNKDHNNPLNKINKINKTYKKCILSAKKEAIKIIINVPYGSKNREIFLRHKSAGQSNWPLLEYLKDTFDDTDHQSEIIGDCLAGF